MRFSRTDSDPHGYPFSVPTLLWITPPRVICPNLATTPAMASSPLPRRGGSDDVCKYGLCKPRRPHSACGDAEIAMASSVTASPRADDDGRLISPTFLADPFGYCVQRLFYTADQIAAKQVPDNTVLQQVHIFHVACADTDMPAVGAGALGGLRRAAWLATVSTGWADLRQSGPGLARRRWVEVVQCRLPRDGSQCGGSAAMGGLCREPWLDRYPQAGDGCVDP